MGLSNELISQFAKITNDNKKVPTESTIYGTTVMLDGRTYVRLDGSDRLTPVETTTVVGEDERVIVTIKNHTATITGNISSPAAQDKTVKELGDKIDEFDTVIADKVKAETAEIETAIITKLDGKYATFDGLDAKYASIDSLEAAEGEIGKLKADNVEINKTLTARDAEIDQLKAKSLTVEVADAKYATIENLEGLNADFNSLEATYADFVEVTTNSFEALEAEIAELDVESLNAKYANIDFTNIGKAAMENFYANSGLIQNVVVGDQTITGELVGVTIRGDRIIGGSIVADKLVIKGNDGIYYKLNAEGGATPDQLATEEFKNGLHGSNIIANSITAEKIDVKDLVAFGATIGNFNIGSNSIYSGAKSSVGNTTRGIYMDTDGQMNLGDSNNYLKFYKDQNGTYKLAIAAESLTFGARGTSVEDAINDVRDSVNNISVGGRNLVLGTSVPFEIPTTTDFVSYSNTKSYYLSSIMTSDPKKFWLSFEDDEYLTLSYDIYFPRCYKNTALTLNRVGAYWQVNYKNNTTGTNNVWYGSHSTQSGSTNKHNLDYVNSLVSLTATERGYIGHYSVNVNVKKALSGLYADPDNFTVTMGSSLIVDQYGYTTGGYIKNIKLERGNCQTEWTPAPEDVDTGISNAQTSANNALNTANNIQVGGTNLLRHDVNQWRQGTWNNSGAFNSTTTCIACLTQIPIKANTPYIISRFNDNYQMAIVKYGPNGRWYDSGWLTTYPYVITPESADYMLAVHVRHTNNTQTMTPDLMKDTVRFKIEKGNKSTDWTPAPEDVNDSINNIQVGGTNLFQQSSRWTKLPTWWISNGGGIALDTTNKYLGYNTLSTTLGNGIAGNKSQFFEVDVNKTYTFSVLMKSDIAFTGSASVPLHYHCSTDGSTSNAGITVIAYDQSIETANTWKLLYLTFKPKGKYFRPYLYMGSSKSYKVNIAYLKLEEGNKPTAWTPAPEDVTADINTAKNEAAKTATNYLYHDSTTGLVIGDGTKVPTGNNVLIDNDSLDIRKGSTVLASYRANDIILGMSTLAPLVIHSDSTTSYIDLCNGSGRISIDDIGESYGDALAITSGTSMSLDASSRIRASVYNDDASTFGEVLFNIYSKSITIDTTTYKPKIVPGGYYVLKSKTGKCSGAETTGYTEIFGGTLAAGSCCIHLQAGVSSDDIKSSMLLRGTGAIDITGTSLTVTGPTTITGALTAKSTLAVTGNTTIGGTATVTGVIYAKNNISLLNNKVLYGKNTAGADRQIAYINDANNLRLGYGGYANSEGRTDLMGNEIRFYVKYANDTNYKPYIDGGDAVSLEWYGAGFISSSGTKVYFSIPLTKPVIGGCTVSISSVDGITVRQNGQYVYGSTSSAGVKLATAKYAAVVDAHSTFIRVTATMPNTTNAINNAPCGIAASIKLTFAYG